MIAALVMVGSGVGALARWELGGVMQRRSGSTRPVGTATVNLLGAALLGVAVALAGDGRVSNDAATVLGTGFCGGFTTFSTWMVESVRLGTDGRRPGLLAMAVNVGGMLAGGVAAAALTFALV